MSSTLVGVTAIIVDNAVQSIPEGFLSASFNNTGDNAAILTQNGQSWTIPSKGVFELPVRGGNLSWYSVSIDTETNGTVLECVYF